MDTTELVDLPDAASRLVADDGVTPAGPVAVRLDGADWSRADAVAAALRRLRTPVLIGFSDAPLPPEAAPLLEQLTCTLAPDGPGLTWTPGTWDDAEAMATTAAAAPYAATALAGLLDLTARSSVRDGLLAESLAYSLLLSGPDFLAWRASTPAGEVPEGDEPVLLDRVGDVLSVALNRPRRRNAFGRALRDGVVDAMELAELDTTIREVVLTGNGPSFSSGGDLDEFGTAAHPPAAHLLRLQQSAGYAVHRIADRVRVVVHGACVGAGIEVPCFAGRVEAQEGAWFRLPELGMGLIPGAGGTVSVTRRVGRWRTAHLALVNRPVDLSTALRWGLVDATV